MEVIMKKVAEALKTNPKSLEYLFEFGGISNRKKVYGKWVATYMVWDCAAGNHLFDDHPELFGITKHEGHCIRAMFQNAGFGSDESKEQVEKNLIKWGLLTEEWPIDRSCDV